MSAMPNFFQPWTLFSHSVDPLPLTVIHLADALQPYVALGGLWTPGWEPLVYVLPNNYVEILTLKIYYLLLSTLVFKKANVSKSGQICSIPGHLSP